MASAESHPQNDFMNAARKERKRVEIYLVNGIRLTGCIEALDQYLVMLRTPGGLQRADTPRGGRTARGSLAIIGSRANRVNRASRMVRRRIALRPIALAA